MQFKLSRLVFILALLTVVALATPFLLADDLVGDFSTSSNPNGHWSYGTTPSLGGALTLYGAVGSGGCGGALNGWQQGPNPPYVLANKSGGTATCAGTVSVPNNFLDLHPSSTGDDSVVRWTSPSTGSIFINGLFQGLDFVGPTTTDVHILLDGTAIFNANIGSYGVAVPFNLVEAVSAGDTIDFVVGFGSDGNYLFDSTGLQGTINPSTVPEPGTLALLGSGFVGVMAMIRRRVGR
jgi:hypothetical protein